MFNIGNIIELTKDTFMHGKGLVCQVVEIDEDNSNYGYVKILKYADGKEATGKNPTKYANLTLFKLVDKGCFYVWSRG